MDFFVCPPSEDLLKRDFEIRELSRYKVRYRENAVSKENRAFPERSNNMKLDV